MARLDQAALEKWPGCAAEFKAESAALAAAPARRRRRIDVSPLGGGHAAWRRGATLVSDACDIVLAGLNPGDGGALTREIIAVREAAGRWTEVLELPD